MKRRVILKMVLNILFILRENKRLKKPQDQEIMKIYKRKEKDLQLVKNFLRKKLKNFQDQEIMLKSLTSQKELNTQFTSVEMRILNKLQDQEITTIQRKKLRV